MMIGVVITSLDGMVSANLRSLGTRNGVCQPKEFGGLRIELLLGVLGNLSLVVPRSFLNTFSSRAAESKNMCISSFRQNEKFSRAGGFSWDLRLFRRELDQISGLISLSESINGCEGVPDRTVWKLDSGVFYVGRPMSIGIISLYIVLLPQSYGNECFWSLGFLGFGHRIVSVFLHASGIGSKKERRTMLWNVAVLAICWSLGHCGWQGIIEFLMTLEGSLTPYEKE
ncbi:hypothetical protein TorRG33x02_225060 [Trema orientale]|uniref:Uncharacterized protein n=1 Tax=Trema orientale TaxID=63057 RepID=A0A2P5E805_TREOI|nr:hypothetical protein TorRG33x02_225060 [Trema orientale]